MRAISSSSASGLARLVGAVALCALAACALAAPTQAEQIRRLQEAFGPAQQPAFSGAAGLAVYQSGEKAGDVLVADSGTDTISRYKANGEPDPFSALGSNTIDGKEGPDEMGVPLVIGGAKETEIAIDESSGTPTAGDIYATETERGRVHAFAADGSYAGEIREFGSTPFGQLRGVAVDAAGVLYVGDYGRSTVHRFVPTANPPQASDWKSPDCPPGGRVGNVAVAGGHLYALTEGKGVVRMNSATCAIEGSPFGPTSLNAILTADPVSGHVFVAEGGKVREYTASGSLVSVTTVPAQVGGIAVRGATDRLYLSQGDHVDTYGSVVTVPTVETKPQSAPTPTRATLNGTVNPDGKAVSECHFEYIDRNHFNFEGGFGAAMTSVPCTEYESGGVWHPLSSLAELGAGSAPVAVRTRASGMIEHERYFFRLIAASECEPLAHPGEQCVSPVAYEAANERAFTLPATTLDETAGEVGGSSAVLKGTLNPDGTAVTDCHFEYLTEAAYLAARTNEIQTLTLAGAGEGSFRLSFEGETTHPIPFDATAAEVKAALEELFALHRISPTVAVSGEARGPYEIEFTGAYEDQDVEEIEADGTEFGPSGATATVATARQGASGWEAATSLPCGEYEAGGTWHPLSSLAELGEGEAPVPVHSPLGSLQAATNYRERLVASNGNVTDSANRFGTSFETKHTVETRPASEVGGHTAVFNGAVNPLGEAVSECRFEYGTDTSYGQSVPCAESDAEIEAGEPPFAVHADISGLDPTTTYHFRLAARIAAEQSFGGDLPFTTLGPEILAQWAEAVTASEARLRATIDAHGSPSAYRLIWGPASEPGAHVEASHALPEGAGPKTVGAFLEGLAPGASYRYRFIVLNACGHEAGEECEVQGKELSFTTYLPPAPDTSCPNQAFRGGPAASLPDCRAYEMVSPAEKNGGDVAPVDSFDSRGMPGQSSLDGEDLAFGSKSSFAGPVSSNKRNQYIARRGAGGWNTEAIAPPLETPGVLNPSLGVNNETYAYSPDLCSSWLNNENQVPLSGGAQSGFNNLYRRADCGPGAGAFEALTVDPSSEECHFGPQSEGLAGIFVGASADLAAQVFQTAAPLTLGAATGACAAANQIYDLAGGGLHLVSVLPDGTASPLNNQAGSPFYLAQEGFGSMHGAVSVDGSHAFWTVGPNAGFGAVYVRLNPGAAESTAKDGEGHCVPGAGKACTMALSEPGSPALLLDSSADGEEALLLSKGRLELVASQSGERTQIAAGLPTAKAPLYLNTGFLGAAADLSRIYFVSGEALAPGAEEGANNLYLYQAGQYTLIGALSAADVGGSRSPVGLSANAHDARVSPDGAHLAFVSGSASLAQSVGYDNAAVQNGEAAREVYLYDATTGRLSCASCNPSGARPHALIGRTYLGTTEPPTAALLPIEPSVYHASRPLSDDGSRLFFESYDPLVPTDTNGTWDVYEWEQAGHGSCHEGAADYHALTGGCVDLISTGLDPQPSEFFDADPSGKNVFIRTASSLDPRDEGAYDVYDAREGGGLPAPGALPGCEGEACQSPPGAPEFATPASEAFEGAGNLPAAHPRRCPKGRRKVRRRGKVRCLPRHKHRRHARHRHKRQHARGAKKR